MAGESGSRLRRNPAVPEHGGLLRPGITADDVVAFVSMADSAPTPRLRRKAQEALLADIAAER